eukprot:127327_1
MSTIMLLISLLIHDLCLAADPTCLKGLLNTDQTVCAPSYCTHLCGTGCGGAGPDGNCCCGNIKSSGRYCILNDAPCIMPTGSNQQTQYDIYGIKKFYQSVDTSSDFFPNWINAQSREFWSVNVDPYSTDNSCYAHGSSTNFYIDGTNGIMTVNGKSPRYYCYLDNLNTEITVYAKRGTETEFKSYAGFAIGARSNHRNAGNNKCDARGYYFRLYNDGRACFSKEFIHSFESQKCTIYSNPICSTHSGIVSGKWYGLKFILQNYDNINNGVNLMVYIDYDNGVNGGNWQLLLEYTDKNEWYASIDDTEDDKECMKNCNYNGNENWYKR